MFVVCGFLKNCFVYSFAKLCIFLNGCTIMSSNHVEMKVKMLHYYKEQSSLNVKQHQAVVRKLDPNEGWIWMNTFDSL